MEKKKTKALYALIFISLSVLVYTMAGRRLNSDVYFLVNNGSHLVSGSFRNFSTIHKGIDLILQQPLSAMVLYLGYLVLGLRGILIISVICAVLTCFLLRLLVINSTPAAEYAFVFTALLFMPYVFNGRPFMFTAVFFLISLNILERVKDGSISDIWVFMLLPISLLQLYFHAAFYLLLLLLYACYLAPRKIDLITSHGISYRLKMVLVLVSSLILSFMSGYKAKLPLYLLLSYVSVSAPELPIIELKAPSMFSPFGLYALLIILLLFYMTRKADGIHYLLAFFGFCFLLLHQRNFALATLFILPLFKDLCLYLEEDGFFKGVETKLLISSVCVAVPVAFLFIALYHYPEYAVNDSKYSPIKAAAYLGECDDIVLFNDFNQGAFLEFCGFDTYIDARPEVYTKILNGSRDILSEYMELRSDPDFDYMGFIERYGFTHFVTDKDSYFYVFLDNSGDFEKRLDLNGYALFEWSK